MQVLQSEQTKQMAPQSILPERFGNWISVQFLHVPRRRWKPPYQHARYAMARSFPPIFMERIMCLALIIGIQASPLSKRWWTSQSLGTVKTNKKYLPKDGIFPTTGKSVKPRGAFECRKMANKEIYFTSWQDKKPVHLLSTWRPYLTSTTRNTKNPAGEYVCLSVPSPNIIKAYNNSMGGTDKFDQFESYYDDRARTVFWKHRIFSQFFRAACINAKILYCVANRIEDMSLLDFFRMLVSEWSGTNVVPEFYDDDSEFSSTCLPCNPKKKAKVAHRSAWRQDKSRLSGPHFPGKLSNTTSYDADGVLRDGRKRCKVCSSRTTMHCVQCGVPLCMTDCNDTNCFVRFHTLEHFELWPNNLPTYGSKPNNSFLR